jgi:hypothetical protein
MKYLYNLMENKKSYKLEEEEVLEMLNENLQLELIVHLNGKMLHETIVFSHFEMHFISELTFSLQR